MRRDWRTRLRLLVAVALLVMPGVSPIAVIALQATPSATTGATAQPECPARPIGPANLVAILREPVPEDLDAENPSGEAAPPAERAAMGELVAAWT
ncbi:MAG: hypothetical protein ACRDJC_25125, partial [Thermomicrobiales bacterium]